MKKRLLSFIFVMLILPAFTGCGAKDNNMTEVVNKEAQDDHSNENVAAGVEEAAGTSQEQAESDPAALMEAFMNGEEPVYFNRYNPYPEQFDKNKPYTLSEIIRTVANTPPGTVYMDLDDEEYSAPAAVENVRYAWLDLGQDNVPELAVEINLDSLDGELIDTYILKEFQGKLEAVHMLSTMYRSYEDLITTYGLINTSASFGYDNGYYSDYYLDGNGELHTVYRGNFYYYIEPDIFGSEISEKYSGEADADTVFRMYDLDETPAETDEEYYREKCLFSTDFPEDYDLVSKICQDAGFTFVTQEELAKLIDERKAGLGCSVGAISEEEIPEWKQIETKVVSDILTYGLNPVYVKTAGEFVDAISDNTTVVIDTEDELNITEYIKNNMSGFSEFKYENAEFEAGVFYRHVNDGEELVINGVDNLRIMSKYPDKKSTIVCEPRYANVISFEYCRGVTLDNLYAGHTMEQGSCSGAVFNFNYCDRINIIKNCDLYGCGTYGITASQTDFIDVYDTVIHDCSYGCVDIYDSLLINFERCTFENCEEFTMFDLMNTNAWFRECTFREMRGNAIALSNGKYAMFEKCTFDRDTLNSLETYAGAGEVRFN